MVEVRGGPAKRAVRPKAELAAQEKSYTAGPERPTARPHHPPYIDLVPGPNSVPGPPKEPRLIQLATDPNARNAWRPAAADGKESPLAAKRGRTGHAWPFISRQADRLATPAQAHPRAPHTDNGS